jgi:signal transduction histidine kinase
MARNAGERVHALEEALKNRKRELFILSAVASRIHNEDDVTRILQASLQEILSGLGLDAAWVLLSDRPSGKLRLVAQQGVSAQYLREIEAKGLSDCLCPEVFASRHRMQVRNTTQCPRMPTIVEGLREPVAHACIPLDFEGASRGVLNVAARPGQLFAEDELHFLETVGRQVCLAVERARHLGAERLHARENTRLYENAERAYRDLSDAQARIIQGEKLAVAGTFAAGLAHEIRNPLNSISLQISILERRAAPLEASLALEMRGLLAVIRDELERLDHLVGDFLAFSGAGRVQLRPVRLDGLVDEVFELLSPEARGTGVLLERRPAPTPLPELPLDREKIKQVLINLVQNAIEAQPRGGRVAMGTDMREGRARVVIEDEGPGLPSGTDVFQLFVTTKARGTGLGLPIAQQIVLEHGGEIRASRNPGKGATFTISLPTAASAGDHHEERA